MPPPFEWSAEAERRRPKPIEQLEREYDGQWLLIEVTRTDRSDTAIEGILLARSPTRRGISEARRGADGDLLVAWAGDPVAEGHSVIVVGYAPL
jgi:hypothetical protein